MNKKFFARKRHTERVGASPQDSPVHDPHDTPRRSAPVRYLNRIEQIPQLNEEEASRLKPVTDQYIFRSNDYYQSLIDWTDPDDPIRRLIVPDVMELEPFGELDASQEEDFTPVRGLEHKYDSTALLLVNEVCAAYCRFCFRKRLFMDDNDEVVKDVSEGLRYIRAHREITNVLLTGGDPLVMSTSRLEPILRELREIDHVNIIRIGTKIPAFNPYRILDDPDLLEMLGEYSLPHKRIYIMAHFNHPVELTDAAVEGVHRLLKAGAVVVNQTPLIRGVNDNPKVLSELFRKLSFIGAPPYYVFQCRPTSGNRPYTMPIEQAYRIFEQARMKCSGLAKRARLVMSHATGKLEIMGLTPRHVFFKYHRAARNVDSSRILIFRRDPDACWLDDYGEPVEDFTEAPGDR